jgi:formylmethanofuran dehydrogenase subunit A
MGTFPGWENYKKGHITGCDIGKKDDTCVAEIKNNTNTMNSSSKESVLKKLKKQKDLGKRALLVVINGDTQYSVKDGIETISGRQFYGEISGRLTFMDDMLSTVTETFKQYNTFEALKLALENS